jgi:hypothetical protein
MLTRVERDWVIEDLADHVGLSSPIGGLIRTVFAGPNRAELGNLPLDLATVPDQAAWVVDSCLTSRWRLNPSLLELLLLRLVNQGGKGRLAYLLPRVQARTDANPDPFNALWVLADQPFQDRASLRVAPRHVIENSARPILRVFGPPKSGKSYTTELFSFVMQESRPDLHVVPVQLAPGTAASYEVEELADSLTLSMEKADPLPKRSNSSYPGALSRWLIRNANRNPGVWVFVLDGFAQPDLKPEVIELVQLLAQQVAIPEFAKKLRLILLHFDQPLTGNWRAKTIDDSLQAGGITTQDITNCLTDFNSKMLTLNHPEKMIKAEDIPVVAAQMLTRSSTAASVLQYIYDELMALAV